ncbi:MAG: hypothetical protein C4521_11470 [Actinobacteria bacterium]|nr:MAG: hypothetical protein C4521_11470 [Actinomycetota bacterium]
MLELRRAILAALVLLLVAGCYPGPATSPRGGLFSRFGSYPPLPKAMEPHLKWQSPGTWRTVVRERYRSVGGRTSIDLDASRLLWVEAKTGSAREASGPASVVMREAGGGRTVVWSATAGRIVESAHLSHPFLAVLERSASRVWDWRLLVGRVEPGMRGKTGGCRLKEIASGKRNGAGKRQFLPTIDLDGDLLVWDERERRGGRSSNVIVRYDLRTRSRSVLARGNVHMPSVSQGRVAWNEESVTASRSGVGVTSRIRETDETGGCGSLRSTSHAMFATRSRDLLAWLDIRRRLLSQPAIADVYCSLRRGPTLRLTNDGLSTQAIAGDGLVAWQDLTGAIFAADVGRLEGFRLVKRGGREGVLWDVDGRRLVYELQPRLSGSGDEREMVVLELGH